MSDFDRLTPNSTPERFAGSDEDVEPMEIEEIEDRTSAEQKAKKKKHDQMLMSIFASEDAESNDDSDEDAEADAGDE